MLLRPWPLLLVWLGLCQAVAAHELRVCMTDVPHRPWRIPDADGRVREQGMDFWLLREFGRRSGWTIELRRGSTRRCLQDLVDGHSDAVLGFSYLPERASLVRYPMKEGRPDESLALRLDTYSWYLPKAAKPQWQGPRLVLPERAVVAVQAGHSIVHVLAAQGYRVDDSARTAALALGKVVGGQAAAAALPTTAADSELALDKRVALQLQRLDAPAAVRAYYLVFSHHFAGRHEPELPGLWRLAHELTHGLAYQKALHEAMHKP